MAAARALYEFDIEVDSVPLLVYREPEAGGRSFVCSVDDAAYEVRCYNHSAEPLSGTVSIDSKVTSAERLRFTLVTLTGATFKNSHLRTYG